MAVKAFNKSTPKELFPTGTYPARIYQIIHVGIVAGFQGELQNKARITFEFPTELKVFKEENGEQPLVLSEGFTLSFNEKANLRKVIDACDPAAIKDADEYDIENLLGKTCLVTVSHVPKKDGSGDKAKMTNFSALPKGMECPKAINAPKVLNYTDFDREFFIGLPSFVQDEMRTSEEYKSITTI